MQEWRYRIFSKILSTPIRRVMQIPMQFVLGSLIIIFALTKIFHLSATCSHNWRRRMANRLINLLCVSVDRQGIVILVYALDDNVRDQLIEKLPDIELKKKLLETRNITLAQVLEKTRASEAAGQQVKHMAGVLDVNDQSAKTCFSCGKAGHFSWDPCCPSQR